MYFMQGSMLGAKIDARSAIWGNPVARLCTSALGHIQSLRWFRVVLSTTIFLVCSGAGMSSVLSTIDRDQR